VFGGLAAPLPPKQQHLYHPSSPSFMGASGHRLAPPFQTDLARSGSIQSLGEAELGFDFAGEPEAEGWEGEGEEEDLLQGAEEWEGEEEDLCLPLASRQHLRARQQQQLQQGLQGWEGGDGWLGLQDAAPQQIFGSSVAAGEEAEIDLKRGHDQFTDAFEDALPDADDAVLPIGSDVFDLPLQYNSNRQSNGKRFRLA